MIIKAALMTKLNFLVFIVLSFVYIPAHFTLVLLRIKAYRIRSSRIEVGCQHRI